MTLYENRLARARAAMRSQGIDLLLLTPSTDLFYLTGHAGPSVRAPCLLPDLAGGCAFHLPGF